MGLLDLCSHSYYNTSGDTQGGGCMAKSLPHSIRLDQALLRRVRILARSQNRSLNNFIETVLQDYVEEYELLANPEFQKALKEAERDEGIPWRKAMNIV